MRERWMKTNSCGGVATARSTKLLSSSKIYFKKLYTEIKFKEENHFGIKSLFVKRH